MKQLSSWHLSALKVISEPMSALARTSERDGRTRTTNENCTANESWTRTKYLYDTLNRLVGITYPTDPSGSAMPNVCKANGSPSNNANVCYAYGTTAAS